MIIILKQSRFLLYCLKLCLLVLGICGIFAKVNAQPIELLTGLAKPPFVISDNEGLQIELVKAALANQNIESKFILMPLGRNVSSMFNYNFDGVLTLPESFQHPKVHLSKPYITYQNVAVSLASNNFVIDNFKQLSGKSIVAFQGAKKFLSDDYADAIAYSTNYREVADQKKQVNLLFGGNTQVIVLEKHILEHILSQQSGILYQKPYRIHPLFTKKDYVAGFRNKELADKFNLGIVNLKEQGEYQAIIDKYVY